MGSVKLLKGLEKLKLVHPLCDFWCPLICNIICTHMKYNYYT